MRFLEAFGEGLKLARGGFGRTQPKERGRPPFAPGDLLKLSPWGYLNQTRSRRRLERAGARNLELIWLRRKLWPDFKTMADFRKDNAKPFQAVFRQFKPAVPRLWDLFGKELVAIEGTKLKAVHNPARHYSQKKLRLVLERIDARREEFMAALDQADSRGTCDGD